LRRKLGWDDGREGSAGRWWGSRWDDEIVVGKVLDGVSRALGMRGGHPVERVDGGGLGTSAGSEDDVRGVRVNEIVGRRVAVGSGGAACGPGLWAGGVGGVVWVV
jgi:hypothetical protein